MPRRVPWRVERRRGGDRREAARSGGKDHGRSRPRRLTSGQLWAEGAGSGVVAAVSCAFTAGSWALGAGARSIVRTWRVLPAAVRTKADGMTPVLTFSI